MDSINSKLIVALKGNESLLLVLPVEVSNHLNIENHESLKFEVKNREIVIKKIKIGDETPQVRLGGAEL